LFPNRNRLWLQLIIPGSLWIDSGNEIRRDILEEFLSHSLGEDCARDPHISSRNMLGSGPVQTG